MPAARIVAIAQATSVVLAGCLVAVLAKRSLAAVQPFTFVWLQIAVGGVALTVYTFVLRGERIPRGLSREVWLYIAGIGVGNFTVVRVVFLLGLGRLPASTHAYLVNFVGFVTMFLSVLMLRERPSAVQVAGAALGVGGLWVFFDSIPPPRELTGVLYVAVGVCGLALTNNLARKLAVVTENGLSNNVVSTVALWIGGGPVVIFGLVTDTPPLVPSAEHWLVIVLNAVVSIAIGMTVWNHILRTLRSYEASVLAASSVVFVALFAVPILGERLALHQSGGIALMVVGLSLSQVRRERDVPASRGS